MEASGGTQALVATFAFGAVALAAFGAAFLFIRGNGRSLFRDGLRLVLVAFFVSAALWSVMGFAATLVYPPATTSCQVLVVFAAAFDQLARIAIEQFLLWGMRSGQKASSGTFILQALILLRFLLGGVLVGVQRPQFRPACVASNLLLPLGIAALATDALFVSILFIRFTSLSLLLKERRATPGFARIKSLFLTTAALGVWIAMSVPMILGIKSFALAVRTVLPAAGLLVLLGIMILCKNSLIIIIPSIPELPPSPPTTRDLDTDKALPDRPPDSRGTDTAGRKENAQTKVQEQQPRQFGNTATSPRSFFKPGSRQAKNLPIINRPSPGQTERGMGGVPVQGQLFPPIRASTAPVVLQKPAKKTLQKPGKIVISKPVIRESSGQNPMSKIATVDLVTAAKNDKERRAVQPSAMATIQTAPSTQQTVLKNPQVFKRKQVASPAASGAAETKRTSALLLPDATSTAAEVSPGIEDLRRRSPRVEPEEAPFMSATSGPMPHVVTTMISPPPRSLRRPSTAGSQRFAAAAAPPIPLQNPKRQSTKSPLRDSSGTQVFVDPNTPPVIPSPLRQPKANWPPSKDMGSPLVPRVKPLPMPFSKGHSGTASMDEHLEHPKNEPGVFALGRGRSVKRDIRPSRQRPQSPQLENQGPTKTPVQMRLTSGIPLNPKSRHARGPSAAPSDKTYTVMFLNGIQDASAEQKMAVQAQSSMGKITAPARDSVVHRPRPIPRKSTIYKADFSAKLSPSVYRHRRSRSGGSIELMRASLISSTGMLSSIPSFPQPPKSASAVMIQNNSHDAVKPSLIPEVPSAGLSGSDSTAEGAMEGGDVTAPSTTSSSLKYHDESRRQSSPLLPASELRQISMLATEGNGRLSGATAVAPLRSARQDISDPEIDDAEPAENDGRETVVLMLDTASEGNLSAGPRRSSSLPCMPASWHRRVGDVCPTFSVRRAGGRSQRRVPPPTPLLLSKSTRSVLVVETEPSPLESPQQALDAIQQQLKRLERAEEEAGPRAEAQDKQRRTLLENIEAEMGVQESHWLQIRQDLAGRSPSSTRWSQSRSQTQNQTPVSSDLNLASPAQSPPGNAPTQSELESELARSADVTGAGPWRRPRQNRPADRNLLESPRSPLDDAAGAAVRPRLQSGGGVSITSDDGSGGLGFVGAGGVQSRTEPGTPSSHSTPSSPAQNKRLLSARIRAVAHRLSSPTPPDSDESDSEAVESADFNLIDAAKFIPAAPLASLAHPALTYTPNSARAYQPPHQPVSHWSIGSDATSVASQVVQSPEWSYETPTAEIHPETLSGTSNLDSPARILDDYKESSTPTLDGSDGNVTSFSPSFVASKESPRRSSAQKPPRKSKRITLLPDIPESPQPLENKRGTLGIFQFPWGETSDIATLQPQRIAYMAMPGTMASGVPVAQAPVLESQGYPTSFFDHYDDEDARSIAADSDGSVGQYSDDEDFDESTLWEIANLLKSDKIPSRDSLFPAYEPERPPSRAGLPPERSKSLGEAKQSDTDKLLPALPRGPSLWIAKPVFASVPKTNKWMAQPDKKVWKTLLDENSETLRAPLRKAEATPISSFSLWKPAEKVVEEPKLETSWLWAKPTLAAQRPAAQTEIAVQTSQPDSSRLWRTPATTVLVSKGLPQTSESWDKYLATKAQTQRAKPRAAKETPVQSSSLWIDSIPRSAAATTSSSPSPPPAQSKPSPATALFPKTPSSTPFLWTPPAELPEEQTDGLFSLDHVRHTYRTTTQKPAALETRRKLRIDTRPLQAPRSNALWTRASVSHILTPPPPQNWLSLSLHLQNQPITPASASVIDSDASDTSSIYSEETETSTLASSAVMKSQTPRKKRTAAAEKEKEKAEWDAALQEALASSRIPAAKDDDSAAAREDKLFFDVTTSHPVFAVDVLHITSDTCHPAATGYLHTVINGAPKKRKH